MEWRGYDVTFVQNFTDIDDKLIKKANEEGITVPEVAERYIKEFWTDVEGMNIRKATVHPRATENIEPIIDQIELAMRQIGQNGNPRIVFTHFALAVSKYIARLQ